MRKLASHVTRPDGAHTSPPLLIYLSTSRCQIFHGTLRSHCLGHNARATERQPRHYQQDKARATKRQPPHYQQDNARATGKVGRVADDHFALGKGLLPVLTHRNCHTPRPHAAPVSAANLSPSTSRLPLRFCFRTRPYLSTSLPLIQEPLHLYIPRIPLTRSSPVHDCLIILHLP